jgi:WD40 repeat protein
VVWDDYGNLYRSYSVRDLSDSVPLGDALPKSKEVDTVAALQGSEIAVLTEDGILARVNAADGAGLGRPFRVDPTPNPPDASADAQGRSELVARPRHPGQVAVVTTLGAARGEILLWDTRKVRRIAKLPGPGIVLPDHRDTVTYGLVFDADGSHLAVQNSDGQVHVWDVDDEKKLDRSAPRSTDDTLVGFGPGDSIVTYLADKVQIQIHDLTGDGASTTLAVEERDLSGGWLSGFVDGPYLTIETGDLRQTFDLRPDAQFRTLCVVAARDYTEDERRLLPKGTPPNPPCG